MRYDARFDVTTLVQTDLSLKCNRLIGRLLNQAKPKA